jgi:alpha-D-xyloside xylohydrolase
MPLKQVLACAFFLYATAATAQQYERTTVGVKTKANNGNVELRFFKPDIVQVVKSPAGTTVNKKSVSVIKAPVTTALQVTVQKDELLISSAALLVKINQRSGQIRFLDKSGRLLLSEAAGVTFLPAKDGDINTYTVQQAFKLDAVEAIYGLGQHQKGLMNQRNQELVLKQGNMQIAVPFFQSVKGYGLFWDNYSTTVFHDSANIASFRSATGDCADYYFIKGSNADQVIAGFRYLTGEAPLFPRWLFGFWQSRERYKSQYETVDVVKQYRQRQVPLDGIVQDWQYWGEDETYWNSTEFGNPRFPDPKAMIDSVHQLNAHIIISVWPSFGNKTKIYQELKAGNMLFDFTTWPINPNVQVYDAFNSQARDIYWRYMNKNIFSLGMDGWWLDATEPDQLKPKASDDENKTYLGSFRKMRNAFPLMTTGGVYDHQRQTSADKRVFILTRSAFAGQQRYGTMTWSGDIQSRWDVLRAQISAGCNLSLSGIPYWNSDIGGFFPRGKYPKGVKDPAYQELYVRWLQFGTFCPMMRSHGEATPREIYQFGEKGSWAYDAIEKYIHLRYRLLPYIYSNARSVTAEASTLMRALVMDFAGDKKVLDLNNEYLFGKSLLVCPVTDEMYATKGTGETTMDFSTIKTKKVYLPAGTAWFDFWTGEKLAGGQEVNKQVPIDVLPLYVKAGSILPVAQPRQYTSEKKDEVLEIRVYEGANGTFSLYEDENDNYNYEKGVYAEIGFTWNDKLKTLSVHKRKGSFPGMLQTRRFHIVKVSAGKGAGMETSSSPARTVTYTGQALTISL